MPDRGQHRAANRLRGLGSSAARAALAGALAGALALFACAAAAQQQSLPGGTDVQRLQQRFKPPTVPRASDKPLIPQADEPLPPAEADKIRFMLNDLVVEGSTIYDPAALRPLYADKLGQETNLSAVYEIAKAITAKYRNDGYILVQVFPPAQRVRDGIVTLRVLEGYINKVELEGNAEGHQHLLESYANKILASRPLRNEALERYLLLANDLPGITAKAILLPSFDAVGASDLILQVRQTQWDATASLDNRGTRFIGPFQAQFGFGYNALFDRSDRSDLRFITTAPQNEELRYFLFQHSQPIGVEGTTLTFGANHSRAAPGFSLEDADVNSRSTNLSVEVRHPYIRARRMNLSLNAGFTYRDSRTTAQNLELSEDKLRFVTLGASFDMADAFNGINLVDVSASQGLDILGERGSPDPAITRPSGRTAFTKLTLDAARLQRLTENIRLVLGISGQYAISQLLASEEFGFGGAAFGRAFDPSEYSGDHGIAEKLELQYELPGEIPGVRRWQYYAYFDYGTVWRIDEQRAEDRESASAVGAGIRASLMKNISSSIELAKPVLGRVAVRGRDDNNDVRLFVSLSARF